MTNDQVVQKLRPLLSKAQFLELEEIISAPGKAVTDEAADRIEWLATKALDHGIKSQDNAARFELLAETAFYDGQLSACADLEARIEHLESGVVCGDCDGSGWQQNRVEGRYPCTCMTEAEPYQILEATIAEQAAELESLRKDAERYRWITQRDHKDTDWVESLEEFKTLRDTRIDASIAAAPKEN